MQLVIDISKDVYEEIMVHNRELRESGKSAYYLEGLIQNGTPLPEGHGRLIDEQNISDYVHSHILEINTGYGDLNNHTNRILRMIESYIDTAPTIIEADAESEDKE